ncbi:MAG: MBL fold metallo-hydrolase [Patescibacteria group bacterium]
MVISYIGGHCFKLSSGDTTIAINPPRSTSEFKVSKFGADVVLISAADPEWDGEETASHGGKEPFVIRGPGAYEVGDVVVTGYASEGALGKETSEFGNTVYVVEFDGMKVLLLGALSSTKLSPELRADLDEINIVFVPVGGKTLDPKGAHELVVSLEPNVIIPYAVDGDADIKSFVKTAGAHEVKPVDKLTLRAKEVALMSGEVVLLK